MSTIQRKIAITLAAIISASAGFAGLSAGPASATTASSDRLELNQSLSGWASQSIVSQNKCFRLTQQADGNLVIYRQFGDGKALWATGTWGETNPSRPWSVYSNTTVMQSDGNLVTYGNYTGRALWASNTAGKGGVRLVMQNDGNLVMYNAYNYPVWASNTLDRNMAYLGQYGASIAC